MLTVLPFLTAVAGLSAVGPLPLLAQETPVVRESQHPSTIETIASGLDSAYPSRNLTLLVIRDREDWLSVWNLLYGREASRHQLPDIDFEQFSVIALFAGRSSPTEAIQIARIERNEEGGGMAVYAVRLETGLGCTGPRTSRNPFHMVKAPVVKKQVIPSLEIELLSRQCVDNLKPPR